MLYYNLAQLSENWNNNSCHYGEGAFKNYGEGAFKDYGEGENNSFILNSLKSFNIMSQLCIIMCVYF